MNESKIKITGILIYFSLNLSSGWMFMNKGLDLIIVLMVTTLLSLAIQWEIGYRLILLGREKYPRLNLFKKRVTVTFFQIFFCAFIVQLASDFIVDKIILETEYSLVPLRLITLGLQAIVFSFTIISLFEAYYYYTNLLLSEKEKEELIRINLQSKLDSLKSQVNPHFLFNSLNTLSSLITKDAVKAEIFVEEMSNVYRFLLRKNEHDMIYLEDELEFIKSYVHLLITRFGENLKVEFQIDEAYLEYKLPALTLQLLIENAVKHNIITDEQPLTIRIFTTLSDRLHVVNNLQKKNREVFSEKTGIVNIISKYKLLKQPEVEIKETAHEFIVILPLVKVESYASLNS